MAALPCLLEFLCFANFAPTAHAAQTLRVIPGVLVVAIVPTFQAKILNVTVMHETLYNAVGEAGVAKILQAW